MRWLPIILVFLYIYIEITVFMHVVDLLGLLMAILLVIFTSAIGLSLVRNQGFKNVLLVQQKMRDGENPAAEVLKSVSLMLAGLLLLVPGFVTDILGLLLLLPPLQKYLVAKCVPRMRFGRGNTEQGRTFEGEYQRKDDDNNLPGGGDR